MMCGMRICLSRLLLVCMCLVLSVGCQLLPSEADRLQAEVERLNAQERQRMYRCHVERIDKSYASMMENLGRAVRAEWCWNVDCDACDPDMLPSPVRLSKSEFAEALALLKQVQPVPSLPETAFADLPPEYVVHDGKIERRILVAPFGGCGGLSFTLSLYDAKGECLEDITEETFVPASRVEEYAKYDVCRPDLVLPDAAYHRLFQLPASRKAYEKNEALNAQIKKMRAEEERRAAEYHAKQQPAPTPGKSLGEQMLKMMLEETADRPETQQKIRELMAPIYPTAP